MTNLNPAARLFFNSLQIEQRWVASVSAHPKLKGVGDSPKDAIKQLSRLIESEESAEEHVFDATTFGLLQQQVREALRASDRLCSREIMFVRTKLHEIAEMVGISRET